MVRKFKIETKIKAKTEHKNKHNNNKPIQALFGSVTQKAKQNNSNSSNARPRN